MSTDINQYRLPGKAGEPLRIATDHWYCKGLYLSSVCMAVHLKPTAKTLADSQGQAEARDDLRTLMRGLGQRLLEFNLWRPLVGVLEDEGKRFTALAADQEWHRGDFLLFVEETDSINRLAKLLVPGEAQENLTRPTVPTQDAGHYRERLDSSIDESPEYLGDAVDQAVELMDTLLPKESPPKLIEHRDEDETTEKASRIQVKTPTEEEVVERMEAWMEKTSNKAYQLEYGRTTP